MTISRRDVIKAGALVPFVGSLSNFELPQYEKLDQENDSNIIGKLILYQTTENNTKVNIYKFDCVDHADVHSDNDKMLSIIMTNCIVPDVDYEAVKSIKGNSIVQANIYLESKGYIEIERDCPYSYDENSFEVIELENKEPALRSFVMDKPYFICFEERKNVLSLTLGSKKLAEPELLMKYYDPQIGGIQNTYTYDFLYENCIPNFDKLSYSTGLNCGRLIRRKISFIVV